MKKLALLTALVSLVAVPSIAQAQDASGNVNVSATIDQILSIDPDADLDFGTITAGTDATVTPASGAALNVAYNTNFYFEFAGGVLDNGVGDTLTPAYSCTWNSGVAFTCNATNQQAVTDGDSSRTGVINVGGTIAGIDSNAVPAGTYTGTLVVNLYAGDL